MAFAGGQEPDAADPGSGTPFARTSWGNLERNLHFPVPLPTPGDFFDGSIGMSGFRFSLQQVLDYREQLKEQAQVAYARAQAELLREETQAESLRQLLAEQESRLFSAVPGDQGERWLLENYVRGIRADLNATLLRVRSLTALAEESRQELTRRAKEHKILEKLKAKQAERHMRDARVREQRTYDETAAIRFKAPAV